ncbi:MAG TPA: hypothetical protein PLS03_07045 [Terrimicrobiaceae bacterium]|nr:hypothetical protein [Terrimicrobiaceae bacterium]
MKKLLGFIISASVLSLGGLQAQPQQVTAPDATASESVKVLSEKHPEKSQDIFKMDKKLSSGSENERREAIDYFAHLGGVSILIEVLNGEDDDLKVYAARSMEKIPAEELSKYKAELRQVLSESPKWVSGSEGATLHRRFLDELANLVSKSYGLPPVDSSSPQDRVVKVLAQTTEKN